MATIIDRIRSAWRNSDPAALNREVERLAMEGHSQEHLESALESLVAEVRADGADDEAEEAINGVWDRLTGWCHASRRILPAPMECSSPISAPDIARDPVQST